MCSANLGLARVYNVSYLNAAGQNSNHERSQELPPDIGLPPSPVAGTVTLDDGRTVPFCIGCTAQTRRWKAATAVPSRRAPPPPAAPTAAQAAPSASIEAPLPAPSYVMRQARPRREPDAEGAACAAVGAAGGGGVLGVTAPPSLPSSGESEVQPMRTAQFVRHPCQARDRRWRQMMSGGSSLARQPRPHSNRKRCTRAKPRFALPAENGGQRFVRAGPLPKW